MLGRSAAPYRSVPSLRNNSSAFAHTLGNSRALRSPKVAAMNEPKRAKLGSRDATTRNHSTLAAAASLTSGGGSEAGVSAAASVFPPSSRPPPACLSHEIVDTFNVPGELEWRFHEERERRRNGKREKKLNEVGEKKTQKPKQTKKTKKLRYRHDRPPLPRPARLLPRARRGNHPALRARGDVSREGGGGGERCCRGSSCGGGGGSGSRNDGKGTRRRRRHLRLRRPSPAPRRRRPLAPLPPGWARIRGTAPDRGLVVAEGRAAPRLPRRPFGPARNGPVVAAGRAARSRGWW